MEVREAPTRATAAPLAPVIHSTTEKVNLKHHQASQRGMTFHSFSQELAARKLGEAFKTISAMTPLVQIKREETG